MDILCNAFFALNINVPFGAQLQKLLDGSMSLFKKKRHLIRRALKNINQSFKPLGRRILVSVTRTWRSRTGMKIIFKYFVKTLARCMLGDREARTVDKKVNMLLFFPVCYLRILALFIGTILSNLEAIFPFC